MTDESNQPVKQRWLYLWLVPLAWCVVAAINFRYPGDEYAMFAVGSLAGWWGMWLQGNSGSPLSILPFILFAGTLTMLVVGWVLDKLRIPIVLWTAIALATAATLSHLSFWSYESAERALAKNGSYQAYILPAINLGMYFSSIVCIVAVPIWRMVIRRRSTSTSE